MMSTVRRYVFFFGMMLFLCVTGLTLPVYAQDVLVMQGSPRPSVEQLLEWERNAIREGYKFDVRTTERNQRLACFSQGECPAGVPFEQIDYLRIQKAYTVGHCKVSADLNELESLFCSLLRAPKRGTYKRYYQALTTILPEVSSEAAVGILAIARGYARGPEQCQLFVREMVGKVPSAWTYGYYQKVIDCKMLFEAGRDEALMTDLSYFRLSRTASDKTYCDPIVDRDIKAFCLGPFPTPLPDNP